MEPGVEDARSIGILSRINVCLTRAPHVVVVLQSGSVQEDEDSTAGSQAQIEVPLLGVDVLEVLGGGLSRHIIHHHASTPEEKRYVGQ